MEQKNKAFIEKVKSVVRKNFNESCEIYIDFEKKYNFFYELAKNLSSFSQIKSDKDVLDAGCGCGFSTKAISDNFSKRVIGIDISEKMVFTGKKLYPELDFIVADLFHIDKIFRKKFDYCIFNLVVFMLPEIREIFKKVYSKLTENGICAFSFYPEIINEQKEDLLELAFKLTGFNKPKKFVISTLKECIDSLKFAGFKNIKVLEYEINLKKDFLIDFFSIPAQSSSLFPKDDYSQRKAKVKKLFSAIAGNGKIIFKFVRGEK